MRKTQVYLNLSRFTSVNHQFTLVNHWFTVQFTTVYNERPLAEDSNLFFY